MNKPIDVEPAHMKLIQGILQKHLTKPVSVWAFGSRAVLNAKKYSDFYLAVDFASQAIPMSLMADLSYAFEESSLPYKVDIVDWNSIDNLFRDRIAGDHVLVFKS